MSIGTAAIRITLRGVIRFAIETDEKEKPVRWTVWRGETVYNNDVYYDVQFIHFHPSSDSNIRSIWTFELQEKNDQKWNRLFR